MNYDYISQNMRHVADMNNIKHESREKDIIIQNTSSSTK